MSAAVRREDGLVLAVRRPDEPGEELPGVWGLPATTLREDETREAALRRLGGEKLSVELAPLRVLARGDQQRESYVLEMTVYEASLAGDPALPPRTTADDGVTHYDALDWLPEESFREAADRGSLCCRLFLSALTPAFGHPSPASGRGDDARSGRARLRILPHLRSRMVEVARLYRKEPTASEDILWQALRNRRLAGRKFRRRHPIGPFVVDFYCAKEALVVEVDGPIHESQRVADNERQHLLEAVGLRVIRVEAADVESDVDRVLRRVRDSFRFLEAPLSRSRERGRG